MVAAMPAETGAPMAQLGSGEGGELLNELWLTSLKQVALRFQS
jgi:hypothetical protein